VKCEVCHGKRFNEETLQIKYRGKNIAEKKAFPPYFKGTNGAVYLYDITRKSTLDPITSWIKALTKESGTIPILLVGNKMDLVSKRQISYEEGQQIAVANYCSGFFEIAANSGQNITKVSAMLLKLMIQK
jgi:GTPase SAR1 family protein